MIVPSDDLLDWTTDREALLVAAWTPQLAASLDWESTFAEALAGEF